MRGLWGALLVAVSPATAEAGASEAFRVDPDDVETYSETFTFIADLAGGTYVQLQLNVTNAGVGSNMGNCRVLIIEPGKQPYTATTKLESDEWRFQAPTLFMGPCQARAGDSTTVIGEVEGMRFFLELKAPARRVRPPNAELKNDDTYYLTEVLVPRGEASFKWQPKGGGEKRLSGHGYADHSRGTMLPAHAARGWVRFRGLGSTCSTLLLVRYPPKGSPQGWWWPASGQAQRLSSLELQLPDAKAQKLPELSLLSGEAQLKVLPADLLYRFAPAEQYGLAGKVVSAWAGKVVTRTFRAELTGVPGCEGNLPGILEVSHVDPP